MKELIKDELYTVSGGMFVAQQLAIGCSEVIKYKEQYPNAANETIGELIEVIEEVRQFFMRGLMKILNIKTLD